MKTEGTVDNPRETALAALSEAFAQAKRALIDGCDEPLAASEQKCRELEAKVAALESAAVSAAVTQSQALDDERARRAAADERFATLDSEVKEERVALVKEREELKVAQKALGKDKAALKKDHTELKAAQTKLLADKRAAVTNFKRSVAEMEEGLEDEQRPVKLPRKRRPGVLPFKLLSLCLMLSRCAERTDRARTDRTGLANNGGCRAIQPCGAISAPPSSPQTARNP
ncbi:hypothetical protein C8R46DRAFT_470132 [Mycena filopes]|nr:hypothetical protein C8R46DRAFT_470132 [Mycena filopes]